MLYVVHAKERTVEGLSARFTHFRRAAHPAVARSAETLHEHLRNVLRQVDKNLRAAEALPRIRRPRLESGKVSG